MQQPVPPPPTMAAAGGFNYRRNPLFMMREEPTPSTIRIEEARAATGDHIRLEDTPQPRPTAAAAAAAATAVTTGSSSSGSGAAPPIAVPYMALHNVGWKGATFTGRKWVILPMVAGFESTFIANTLQGLLCLPGCESAMMGDPVPPPGSGGASAGESAASQQQQQQQLSHLQSVDELGDEFNDDEEAVHEEAAEVEEEEERGGGGGGVDGGAQAQSPCSSKSPEHVTTTTTTAGGARAAPVLRGGIRSQWGTRVKTAASRLYSSYVLQHLADASIHLRASPPPPLVGSLNAAVVSDTQVDQAEELESLRGQSATVPRCLAPVAVPQERRVVPTPPSTADAAAAGRPRAHVVGTATAALEPSHKDDAVSLSTCGATVSAEACWRPGTVSPPEKAEVLLGDGHSSDDNNSPTPSSQDEEEEAWVSAGGSSTGQSGATGHGGVAVDPARYHCFASNCVDSMPNYPLPQLQSDDLADLAAFMVVRSSLQPDEATDLRLGTHVLGSPQLVKFLSPEQRVALMHRAARLMEAAVFLQV